MTALPSPENIVRIGTFLYDDSVLGDVCISFNRVRFGTGDHEDLPEIVEDVVKNTYYAVFGSTTERGRNNATGGGYPSLAERLPTSNPDRGSARPLIGRPRPIKFNRFVDWTYYGGMRCFPSSQQGAPLQLTHGQLRR